MEDPRAEIVKGSGDGVDIHGSIERGDLESVRRYVKTGGDLDRRDWDRCTPLHIACAGGYGEVAQLLIERGSDLNARSRIEHTPLHLACRYGHLSIALALLVAGAELDPKDNEANSPLHKAASNGHAQLCVELARRGAMVDAVSNGGYTPLHWAAYRGHAAAVQALAGVGADIDARSSSGMTALHVAAFYGHAEAVAALLRAGIDSGARDSDSVIAGEAFHEAITPEVAKAVRAVLGARSELLVEGVRSWRADRAAVWRELTGRSAEAREAALEVDLLVDKLGSQERELNMSRIGARDLTHAAKQLKTVVEENRRALKQKDARISELEAEIVRLGHKVPPPQEPIAADVSVGRKGSALGLLGTRAGGNAA